MNEDVCSPESCSPGRLVRGCAQSAQCNCFVRTKGYTFMPSHASPRDAGRTRRPPLHKKWRASDRGEQMSKARIATVWLDGCSGCHMSFLDMDERLLELAGKVDLVYSPLVDTKEFPANVDIALIEGAVSSEEDLHKIRMIRDRTKMLVSFGDCAVTANVPAMRNPFTVQSVYDR